MVKFRNLLFSLFLCLFFVGNALAIELDGNNDNRIDSQYLGINATYPASWSGTTGVLSDVSVGGKLRAVTYYTANATYTKPSWLKFIRARGVAPGGGGAGAPATNSTAAATGSSGGSGGYVEDFINATDLDSSTVVTIGDPGRGGAAGQNNGTAAGSISFGAHFSATGGLGGVSGAAFSSSVSSQFKAGGAAGVGVGGTFNAYGAATGYVLFLNGQAVTLGGPGGWWAMDTGQPSWYAAAIAGNNYGGAGSGALNWTSQSAKAGADGGGGIIELKEYE